MNVVTICIAYTAVGVAFESNLKLDCSVSAQHLPACSALRPLSVHGRYVPHRSDAEDDAAVVTVISQSVGQL
jgi:hypothetical protein